MNFFKKFNKKDEKVANNSKEAAKERLHLVLMQDRANVSADFLELMKQEIIEVIKKYIDIDEKEIDVRLTNKENADGTNGAPALYANIPILNIKNEARKINTEEKEIEEVSQAEKKREQKKETIKTDENGEKAKKIIKKKEKSDQTNKEESIEKEEITQIENETKEVKQIPEDNEQEEGKEENKQEKTTKEKAKFKN